MRFPSRCAALALASLCSAAGAPASASGPGRDAGRGPAPAPQENALEESLAGEGLRLDLERGVVALPAEVLVRDELLEYVLVGPRGQTHESLFLTETTPSVLNAALLLLGVEPGVNARIEPLADEPDDADPEASANAARRGRTIHPPRGGGFLLYVAWREGEEIYLFRIDDLISDLATGRSMPRHRWVFLGSRFVRLPGEKGEGEDEPERFAADLEGNLVNVTFFFQGNTLVTAALPECVEQATWLPNAWLLPERGSPVWFLFSTQPLHELPPRWTADLPRLERPATSGTKDDAR